MVTKTNNRMIDGAPVNVLDFGAVGDGVADDTVAIQSAFDALPTGGVITFPAGTYLCNGSVTANKSCNIEALGATLNFQSGYLDIAGSDNSDIEYSLLADIDYGVNTLETDGVFNQGDLLLVIDTANNSRSKHRANYKKGQLCRVVTQNGSTVHLNDAISDSYVASATNPDIKVYKVIPIKVTLDGMTINADDVNSAYGLRLRFLDDSSITRCNVTGADLAAVDIQRSYDVLFDDCQGYLLSPADDGLEYGISIGDSSNIVVKNSTWYATRHGAATGGASWGGCYHITFKDCIISNPQSSTQHAADFHGNVRDSRYVNCRITGGANLAGEYNGYYGCEISGGTNKAVIDLTEIVGGRFTIQGCKLVSIGDSVYNSIVRASSTAALQLIDYDYSLHMEENEVICSTSTTYIMYVGVHGDNVDLIRPSIHMRDTTYRNIVGNLLSIIRTTRSGGNVTDPTFDSVYMEEFNKHPNMTNTIALSLTSHASILVGTKFKAPSYSGVVEIEATVGAFENSTSVLYGFDFGFMKYQSTATANYIQAIGTAFTHAGINNANTDGAIINISTTNSSHTWGGAGTLVPVSYVVGGTVITNS